MEVRRSIRTKILTLLLVFIILSNFVITLIGALYMRTTVTSDASEVLTQILEEKEEEINSQLQIVEQSVAMLAGYISDFARENSTFLEDGEGIDQYLEEVHEIALSSLENTPGVKTIYYHVSEDVGGTASGIYMIMDRDGESYEDLSITDLSQYDEDDEAVAWYYEAVNAREGVWLDPYYNESIGEKIISYSLPVYSGSTLLGVVGMDIDTSLITDIIEKVKAYDKGYAFLLDSSGNILYHPDYPDGLDRADFTNSFSKAASKIEYAQHYGTITKYRWNGKTRYVIIGTLDNGTSIAITVPTSRVLRPSNIFLILALIVFVIVIAVAFSIANWVGTMITDPLRELTEVAQKVSGGDLGTRIDFHTGDEVEVLAESIKKMVDEIQSSLTSAQNIAHTDSLTGTWNKSAYAEKTEQLDIDIKAGTAEFSVIVMDLNNLKTMNDTYGHEAGDLWIKTASGMMMKAFGRSRVYRIGGDEFAAILEPNARRNYDYMFADFQKAQDDFNARPDKEFPVVLQVALGLSDFNPKEDNCYQDVFRRADSSMYVNKKYLKGLLI
ncbi:MAG: diguanylate cyclase [Clostridiales bacterium]|nr:diguanylate cyclase [Clostridiales bacterium]